MNRIDITQMARGEFAGVVDVADPGDWIIYHVGAHCGGAHRHHAREAYEAGLVVLTSRRRDSKVFEHIAIRMKSKTPKA